MGPRVELKQEPVSPLANNLPWSVGIIVRAAQLMDYAHRYAFIASVALFMIFCRKKQRTNAKSSRTKVADWQDVGV